MRGLRGESWGRSKAGKPAVLQRQEDEAILSGARGAWFEEEVLGSQGRLCGKQLILDVTQDLRPLQQQAHTIYHRQVKVEAGLQDGENHFPSLLATGHSPSNDIDKMRQTVAHFSCQH